MPSGPSDRATSPAAASTPTWRIPPPTIFLARRARPMNAVEPTTTEPTGQPRPFDRQNVTESAGAASVPGVDTIVPLGDDGVPEPRAVDVERHAVAARDRGDLTLVCRRQRTRHRVGMGVLEGHQARERLVHVIRVAERGVDVGRVERAVRAIVERPRAGTDDDGVAGRLVDHEVMLTAGDHLLATRQVGHHRHQVAHRAGRHEQPGLLAEQLGGALLEGDDGRVVAEDVVADFGRRHGSAHRVGGSRDGVAAEVDRAVGHGPRV